MPAPPTDSPPLHDEPNGGPTSRPELQNEPRGNTAPAPPPQARPRRNDGGNWWGDSGTMEPASTGQNGINGVNGVNGHTETSSTSQQTPGTSEQYPWLTAFNDNHLVPWRQLGQTLEERALEIPRMGDDGQQQAQDLIDAAQQLESLFQEVGWTGAHPSVSEVRNYREEAQRLLNSAPATTNGTTPNGTTPNGATHNGATPHETTPNRAHSDEESEVSEEE